MTLLINHFYIANEDVTGCVVTSLLNPKCEKRHVIIRKGDIIFLLREYNETDSCCFITSNGQILNCTNPHLRIQIAKYSCY